MNRIEYEFFEKIALHECIKNLEKLSEEKNPERLEIYSATVCDIATSIKTLHACIDDAK